MARVYKGKKFNPRRAAVQSELYLGLCESNAPGLWLTSPPSRARRTDYLPWSRWHLQVRKLLEENEKRAQKEREEEELIVLGMDRGLLAGDGTPGEPAGPAGARPAPGPRAL